MTNKINIFKPFSASLFLLFAFLFISNAIFAYDPDNKPAVKSIGAINPEPSGENKKFNAGELIMEHVSDAHEWHLWGHTSIPLPIIIFNKKTRSFDVFLSNRFEGGKKDYKGYRLVENKVSVADDIAMQPEDTVDSEKTDSTAGLIDLSITKNVASLFISLILMLWIFISVAKAYTRNPGKAPKGMQSLFEPIIIFVRDDIAKSSIGEKKHKKYLPFLLTVFFFIWINNLMGLIPIMPGGANVTGNIAIGLVLATIVFVITLITANKHYWRHIIAMPGVPVGILVLLTPIEIFGMFLKPFVLMIRLFANMLAGHIIALSFFSLIFIFAEMNTGLGWGVGVFSVAFTIFMGMLELLVCFLQAYVFTLLAAMYFGSAIDEGHDTHNHHDDNDHARNF